MATVADGRVRPQLYSGDRMSRAEFHRAYALAPKEFRAELIGGVVFVASPAGRDHGLYQALLVMLFTSYAIRTPGVEAGDNTTIILGDDTEPQPDVHIRMIEECGGNSHTTADGYVEGPPEIVAEVSHSSRAIDLHSKYESYARFGVQEYLVVCLNERRIRWFDLQNSRDLTPDRPAVISSNSFPGLLIDCGAVLDQDYHRLVGTLVEGIASPEHSAFLKLLEARRARRYMAILITAGPTREYLDDVRFLSNASSGKMGYALAQAAQAAGHHVILVSGPVTLAPPDGCDFHAVETTGEMYDACLDLFPKCRGAIGAAAVCDYRPRQRQTGKIGKTGKPLIVELIETPDILAELGRRKAGRWIVGFALESRDPHENAVRKLKAKCCDAIVVNHPRAIGAESSHVELIDARGVSVAEWNAGKIEIAGSLMAWIDANLGRS